MIALTKLARKCLGIEALLCLLPKEMHVCGNNWFWLVYNSGILKAQYQAMVWPLVFSCQVWSVRRLLDWWIPKAKYRQKALLFLQCEGFCVQLVSKGLVLCVKMLG